MASSVHPYWCTWLSEAFKILRRYCCCFCFDDTGGDDGGISELFASVDEEENDRLLEYCDGTRWTLDRVVNCEILLEMIARRIVSI